ncbi:MAG: hypothetical protein ACI4VF_01840, partial [Lachnospirales bacterium]
GRYIRIVTENNKALFSKLVLSCGSSLELIYADSNSDSSFGELIIKRPDNEICKKITDYLDINNIKYKEVDINE